MLRCFPACRRVTFWLEGSERPPRSHRRTGLGGTGESLPGLGIETSSSSLRGPGLSLLSWTVSVCRTYRRSSTVDGGRDTTNHYYTNYFKVPSNALHLINLTLPSITFYKGNLCIFSSGRHHPPPSTLHTWTVLRGSDGDLLLGSERRRRRFVSATGLRYTLGSPRRLRVNTKPLSV